MQQLKHSFPGLVIAGLRGGSGKTVISLGIASAWKAQGIRVSPFKKGPDYIDAGWLAQAAGRPCYNLDTFLCTPSQVIHSFKSHFDHSDIAVVEGNRGLFDGIDTNGTTSTAEIAKLLNLPVLLVLDCTKSTRTMAALLMGCQQFDPDLRILGVILNRVAGKRHEGKVRDNIEKYCRVPVFGAVHKLNAEDFPERHMGLVPSAEHALAKRSIQAVAKVARETIDLERLFQACIETDFNTAQTPPYHKTVPEPTGALWIDSKDENESLAVKKASCNSGSPKPVIGIVRDSAFQFYYPDNLQALEESGATLTYISPLAQKEIPDVDAIYMGGGFPETHAAELAANVTFRDSLRRLARQGLPIYAECGGLIFLGDTLQLDGNTYPMAGILPIRFGLSKRPVGHGYTTVHVKTANPFYPVGETIRGHEFRYSSILSINYQENEMAFTMKRGKGIIDKVDGFFKWNTFGTYTHILASGTPSWAESIVRAAAMSQRQRLISGSDTVLEQFIA